MINDIQKKSLEDYKKAYLRLEKYCRNTNNVIIVGQFGEVSNPSISDLDIFICINDTNFEKLRVDILDFVLKDSDLKYMCYHEPLIVPKSIIKYLPFLHSLYSLKLTYNPETISFYKPTNQYLDLLNILWTMFLIPIAINITKNIKKQKLRQVLLVLKNLHQSMENLSKAVNCDDNFKQISDVLRNKIITGKYNTLELKDAVCHATGKVFELMNIIDKNCLYNLYKNKKKIIVNRNIIIVESELNSYGLYNNKIVISLSNYFFSLFYDLKVNKTLNEDLQMYMSSTIKSYNIMNALGSSYPFISPFGYQFYRNDFKFKIRNLFLWLINFLKY